MTHHRDQAADSGGNFRDVLAKLTVLQDEANHNVTERNALMDRARELQTLCDATRDPRTSRLLAYPIIELIRQLGS